MLLIPETGQRIFANISRRQIDAAILGIPAMEKLFTTAREVFQPDTSYPAGFSIEERALVSIRGQVVILSKSSPSLPTLKG